jgi:hypothetical protein
LGSQPQFFRSKGKSDATSQAHSHLSRILREALPFIGDIQSVIETNFSHNIAQHIAKHIAKHTASIADEKTRFPQSTPVCPKASTTAGVASPP